MACVINLTIDHIKMPSYSIVSIISYSFYIYISVVIQRLLLKKYVGTYKTSKKFYFFPEMRLDFLTLIAAVYFLFLLQNNMTKKQEYLHTIWLSTCYLRH